MVVPIIGMGQHQKINYDDSDFNANTNQFRKMPERNNSLVRKDQKWSAQAHWAPHQSQDRPAPFITRELCL